MTGTWHDRHHDERTLGQRFADATAKVLGSWSFIGLMTLVIIVWIALNVMAWSQHWDPYPFILLNLAFSVQAAYAAPIIMMAENRQTERDRYQAQADFETNVRAEAEVEEILRRLDRIEASLERIERSGASASREAD